MREAVAGGTNPTAVVCRAGPALVPGALLASELGFDLEVVGSFEGCLSGRSGGVVVVGVRDELTDLLLLDLLDQVQDGLGSAVPWHDLPHLSLVSGADLHHLTWVVAKVVLGHERRPAPSFASLARYVPAGELTVVERAAWSPADGGGWESSRALRRGDTVLESLLSPTGTVAIATHGYDACAKGGGPIVLCGLRSGGDYGPGQEGVLACGRGHRCPRGPLPLPLANINTDVLLLGSCNGARFADSLLRPEFNLGFGFLDGRGLAYISSIMSTIGHPQASTVFMAAMADGRSVAEATSLMNAFVHLGKVEQPCYVGVGDGAHRLRSGPVLSASAKVEQLSGEDGLSLNVLDAGHVIEVVINDPQIVDLAQRASLAVEVSSDIPGSQPSFFARVERRDDGERAARIFVFRFPEPIGHGLVELLGAEELSRYGHELLSATACWEELEQLWAADDKARMEVLRREREDLTVSLVRFAATFGHQAGATAAAAQACQRAEQALMGVATALLDELQPGLEQGFFLCNLYSRAYVLSSTGRVPCPAGHGVAVRHMLRHPLHRSERAVDICPRCGVVADVPVVTPPATLELAVPERVAAGAVLEARATLVGAPAHADVVLRAGLTNLGQTSLAPTIMREAVTRQTSPSFTLHFSVPNDYLPHHYWLKVVAGTVNGVYWAARPVFIY